ncbi:GGDEF domain-containing protein [Salisediminibacterium selenitireducens]|uniref:Diguanylate cyclase n=1 Tax=Bacillus selenitireducens (strain ATCC 700615 / DSM 15326 / MLS10) TaxID=439292 RepID=D6XWI5_BACIE|nr:GGDEF domain-containing protein [Salisediminibacterium selenitireducens]ADH97827.1 diguanylate cyclase [[Bacillus] selenitireducens MLS10]
MEMKPEELDVLISQLTASEHLYGHIRVVDPVHKRVVYQNTGHGLEPVSDLRACFELFDKKTACRNCISMRAYHENESFIKVETSPDRVHMVTAIPVEIAGRKVVVEFFKDVTNSMIMDDASFNQGVEMKRLLDQANLAAVTDELTRVYNKRYILEKLPADLTLALAEQQPFGLIVADIDHFKSVNDTYGHLAGDQILREFAAVLKDTCLDQADWTARFGGEEFVVCLPGKDRDTVLAVAERMRARIEEQVFHYDGQAITLTSSFGVYALAPGDVIDYETLLKRADQHLYQSKRTGRNRVTG